MTEALRELEVRFTQAHQACLDAVDEEHLARQGLDEAMHHRSDAYRLAYSLYEAIRVLDPNTAHSVEAILEREKLTDSEWEHRGRREAEEIERVLRWLSRKFDGADRWKFVDSRSVAVR